MPDESPQVPAIDYRQLLDEVGAFVYTTDVHGHYTYANQLVLELLGRVPRAGESLTIGPFRVIVERVVRRKIERVFLERLGRQDDVDESAERTS